MQTRILRDGSIVPFHEALRVRWILHDIYTYYRVVYYELILKCRNGDYLVPDTAVSVLRRELGKDMISENGEPVDLVRNVALCSVGAENGEDSDDMDIVWVEPWAPREAKE